MTLAGTGNTWNASGKINGCIDLTGAGSANFPASLLGTITDRTFCTWIYKTATSGAILGEQNLPSFTPILYFGTDGKLYGSCNTGTITPMVSPAAVSNNAWHHVALTRAGNVQTMYLDGNIVGSMVAPIVADYPNAQIGAAYSSGWPNVTGSPAFYTGKFDDVRLYNRALAPAEIWKLFN